MLRALAGLHRAAPRAARALPSGLSTAVAGSPASRTVIVSLTGPDANGVLATTSEAILAAGGDVADSRSAVLRGTGVMVLEVTAPSVGLLKASLESALPGFVVAIVEDAEGSLRPAAPEFSGRFTVQGADNVGLLSQVVGYISSQRLCIKSLVTNVAEAPYHGDDAARAPHERGYRSPAGFERHSWYEMRGELRASRKRSAAEPVDVAALLEGFAALEREMDITIGFEEEERAGAAAEA